MTGSDRTFRIGNAERQAAVDALADHFAQGRLETHEFEERTTAACSAHTAEELDELFRDLPRAGQPPWPAPTPPTGPWPPPFPPPLPHHGPPPLPAWRNAGEGAPFGREPGTGIPYSDKQKVVAGLLQIFLPLGVGRLYTGHVGLGIAQLLVTICTFGFGALWSVVDGIVIIAGRPTDPAGRPLS